MPLLRALNRLDPGDARRARLAAMGEAMEARSVERLTPLLVGESDPFLRETALTHLARLDGAFAAQALVAMLRTDDVALRNAAIDTLGYVGERALDALAGVLRDGDADLRIYGLTALERIDDRRAAELALKAALEDGDVNVCAAALDVVAQCGGREMAGALDRVAARFPEVPYLAFAARAAQQRLA